MLNTQYLKSLAELVVVTYVASLGGLLAADGFDFLSLAAWKVAAVSALPAAVSVVYGAFAKLVGNANSATATDPTKPNVP